MLQLGRDLDLAVEPLRTDGCGQLRVEHLDGDVALMLQIQGQIDRGHAAATQLALDGISVGKSDLETGEDLGHGPGCYEAAAAAKCRGEEAK